MRKINKAEAATAVIGAVFTIGALIWAVELEAEYGRHLAAAVKFDKFFNPNIEHPGENLGQNRIFNTNTEMALAEKTKYSSLFPTLAAVVGSVIGVNAARRI